MKRNRAKHTQSLQERLAAFAKEARERAALLPQGAERDYLLQRASQADEAMSWITSPDLQPPKE